MGGTDGGVCLEVGFRFPGPAGPGGRAGSRPAADQRAPLCFECGVVGPVPPCVHRHARREYWAGPIHRPGESARPGSGLAVGTAAGT